MMLSGRSLVDRGIITTTGEWRENNIQQVGVDLNIVEVRPIGAVSLICIDGAELAPPRDNFPKSQHLAGDQMRLGWVLIPGVYAITVEQGCNIPSNICLMIRQRSSLLRSGAILHSSIFDPGYRTNQIETVISISNTIFLEKGCRVAQIYAHECETVQEKDLYGSELKGSQYQGTINE